MKLSSSFSGPEGIFALTGLDIGGGIAAVSKSMVLAASNTAHRGPNSGNIRVVLLYGGIPPDMASLPNIEYRLCGGSRMRFIVYVWGAAMRSKARSPIVFDLLGLARSLVPLARIMRRIRYGVYVHGLELEGVDKPFVRAAARAARVVLTNSEFTRRRLLSVLPVSSSCVRVLQPCLRPRGATGVARDVSPDGCRVWALVDGADPVVLIVGRMWSSQPGKGHDLLLRAWARICDYFPQGIVVVVGAGDDASRIEHLAEWLGCAESTVFAGQVSDELLGRLYRRADVFAMPSKQEGFGLVYAEAMSHGLPCIASSADAGGEVVRHTVDGLVVDAEDVEGLMWALQRLLRRGPEYEAMRKAAMRRAEDDFGFPKFSVQFASALRSIARDE